MQIVFCLLILSSYQFIPRLNLIQNDSNCNLHLAPTLVSLLAAMLANSSTLAEADEEQEERCVYYIC